MNLIDLKPFMLDIVNSFSAVLDLELTIINADPIIRVAGTGKYSSNYNKKNWDNTYTLRVIKEKKAIVALDTSNYVFDIAKNAVKKYYSLILQPIILKDEVKGVICIASFNKEQQDIIKTKCDDLLVYLEKIASLISSKLEQSILFKKLTINNQHLSTIFESVSDGIILYSKNEGILHINCKAKEMLMFKDKEKREEILSIIYELGNRAMQEMRDIKKNIYKTWGSKNYALIVKATPICIDNSKTVLFVINKFKDIQKIITQNSDEPFPTDHIITNNVKMLAIKNKIDKVAKYSSNILILGESGTGKELIARAIHSKRGRKNSPFVAVNCAAIPETLIESELFGYEEGSFTGAKKGGKIGKFMLANNGTLFLDEIGDMPLYLQAKLLRVLNDHTVEQIGGTTPIKVNVNIIAATNKNLEEMIKKKEFREDLYYRLNVISFHVPPLRERKDDILLLTNYFIDKYNKKFSKNVKGVDQQVKEILMNYNWPGNVRELENCIEYMMNFENEEFISMKNIPQKLLQNECETSNTYNLVQEMVHPFLNNDGFPNKTLKEITQEIEKKVLESISMKYGKHPTVENVKEICKRLDISIATYYRKLKS